jgi:hypothetical protein
VRGTVRFAPGLVAAVILAACTSTASASAPNPARNIKLSPRQLAPCYVRARGPFSRACDDTLIYYLDRARRDTGRSPYRLPADFLALPGARQVFILSNLDRIAYSINPVVGLNRALQRMAFRGAAAGEDPEFVPSPAFPSGAVYGWASNWAGGREPLLLAYYSWMYDDGWGSFNLACSTPSDPGCWGHRQNILWQPGESRRDQPNLSMGAAANDGDYTMLIVATDPAISPDCYYTWKEAVADGAGSHVYRVKRPLQRGPG